MQTKDFTFKVTKALDESGSFTGLASPYGPPADMVGDIIALGAYKQAIASQGDGYPLLWAHKQDEPVGIGKVSDSAAGLVIEGKLLMTDAGAQRAYGFMRAKIIRGLSIGYTVDPAKVTYGGDGTRTLKEVRLFEVSLVAIPCAPTAQISSVKSLAQAESFLRTFRPGQVSPEDLEQLRSIDLTLKSLLRKNTLCDCDCEECLAGDCEDCSDPECDDPSCEGNLQKARKAAEDLAALKSFAASLKSMVPGR
jgi:HK97 family phage prohead protease